MTLKGTVAGRFGSATKMALALNWSGSKARRIVCGKQMPSAMDIEEMAVALGISNLEEFVRVFYPQLYTKWTINGNGYTHESE